MTHDLDLGVLFHLIHYPSPVPVYMHLGVHSGHVLVDRSVLQSWPGRNVGGCILFGSGASLAAHPRPPRACPLPLHIPSPPCRPEMPIFNCEPMVYGDFVKHNNNAGVVREVRGMGPGPVVSG